MMERVILVTGAASGIGAAICRRLAGPGVALLMHTGRNAEGLADVAEAARAAGAEVATLLGDLASPATAQALVAHAVERFGGLDVLVSNAGFPDRTAVADLTDAAFARSLEAMPGAFLRLARAAMSSLRAGRAARVVAVSSFVAHVFRPDVPVFPASAAAKAGLEALVRALAIELAPDATVNAVAPGFIRKDAGGHGAVDAEAARRQVEKIPMGRIGLPEDVAGAVAYLVSAEAGYVTGQVLHVNGGLAITL
jgi:NAD(P)-dependent dehydrogenase (short-subunit alcohol dehydrogenase family)